MTEKFISLKEAAEILGYHPSTLQKNARAIRRRCLITVSLAGRGLNYQSLCAIWNDLE